MKPLPRILSLFLSLTLAVPNSVLALREQPIAEKEPSVLAGLEEALQSDNPAHRLVQLASAALTPVTVSPVPAPAVSIRNFPLASAGLEEEVDIRLKSFGITDRELLAGRKVDTSRLQEQSWTMNGIRPEEKAPIFKDLDQIPLRKLTYPPEKLRRFSSGTSSDAVYLGFVDGISHPVVIKIFKSDAQAIYPAMKELVDAQIFNRLGVGPRFYGLVELEDGRIGYALQLIPGEELREPDAGAGFDEIFDRQHRAGLSLSNFIRTPSGRLVAYDAGSAITFDDFLRSEYINSSAAGLEESSRTGFELNPALDQATIETNRHYLESKGWADQLSGLPYNRPFILEDWKLQITLDQAVRQQEAQLTAMKAFRQLAGPLAHLLGIGTDSVTKDSEVTPEETVADNLLSFAHLLQGLHLSSMGQDVEAAVAYQAARETARGGGLMTMFGPSASSDTFYVLGRFYLDAAIDVPRAGYVLR